MPWFEYIRNNFLLKVFSLALAILIWVAVNTHLQSDSSITRNLLQNIDSQEFTVPVRLLIRPDQGAGYKVSPAQVKVIVSGPAADLKKLSPSRIQVYARLDEAKGPMMSDFALEAKLPREITLDRMEPERVTVETAPGSLMVFPPAPIN